MINVVALGRLTKDPEFGQTSNGNKYVKVSLASKSDVKTEEGYKTDFIDCVAWRVTADNFEKFHFKKGNLVLLYGNLDSRSYEKDGKQVKTWDLVFNKFESCMTKGEKADQEMKDAGLEPIETDELPF